MRPSCWTVNTASGAARKSVRKRSSAVRIVSTSSAFSSETERRSAIASIRSISAVLNSRSFVVENGDRADALTAPGDRDDRRAGRGLAHARVHRGHELARALRHAVALST